MTYVDGFAAAVPIANKSAYIEYARKGAVLFKRHGALKIVDTWGDDVPEGELTSFPMAVKKNDDEAVVFSWILWPSKSVRDEAWHTMMNNDSVQLGEMPFDGKRMIYGGFEMVVDE